MLVEELYRVADIETSIRIVENKSIIFEGILGHILLKYMKLVIYDIELKIDDESEEPYLKIKVE